MRFKSKAVIIYLVCSLFFASAAGTAAALDNPLTDLSVAESIKPCRFLSYGLDVIRNTVKVIKTASAGEPVVFTAYDFADSLKRKDISNITIVSLPDTKDGVLKFGVLDAYAGQVISSRLICQLKFIPSGRDVEQASFTVALNGGNELVKCLMYATPESAVAPSALGMKLYSYRDIPVYSSLDVKASGEISCSVISQPSHGLLKINADGKFTYTPYAGFTGKDAFTYAVRDRYGVVSQPATVTIRIDKPLSSTFYSDMEGNPAEYASVLLSEKNIFIGENIGGIMKFSPENAVSRIDFLVMAMKSAGYSSNVYTASQTGLADESLLTKTQKGYVITALALGIIKPENYNGVSLWRPNATITDIEAASICSIICSEASLPVFSSDGSPLNMQNCALMLEKIINADK